MQLLMFMQLFVMNFHAFSLQCTFSFFTDVGAVLQAALCLHLHCPVADHMGLSLPCLRSAFRRASYPFPAVFYEHIYCILSHQFVR